MEASSAHSEFHRVSLAAARDLPHVHVVDFSGYFCPGDDCNVRSGDLVYFRDRHHFTSRFALTLAPLIEPELRTLLRRRRVDN
jgi:hypothetical protein